MKTFIFPSFLKNKVTKKNIATLISCVFFSFGGNVVLGQNNLSTKLPYDPNNHPTIWMQLQKNPLDSLLWQKYVGKQWTDMPLRDRLQIKLWMQEMWLNQLNKSTPSIVVSTKSESRTNENSVTNSNNTRFADNQNKIDNSTILTPNKKTTTTSVKSLSKSQQISQLLAKPEVKNFMKDLEESFLVESTEMEELKTNLYENFFILEVVLADEFEAMGAEYIFYKQKYPKGNYSESRWMMEKEQELKKLKTQKLKEAKQAFLERQTN